MPRPWQLCLAGCPHVPCKSCISQLSIIYFAGMCCIGSISLPALVLGMYYTYVHTQCMYIKHREPHTHTHTHTSLHTHTHTHTLYSWLVSISHLKVGYNYQLHREIASRVSTAPSSCLCGKKALPAHVPTLHA